MYLKCLGYPKEIITDVNFVNSDLADFLNELGKIFTPNFSPSFTMNGIVNFINGINTGIDSPAIFKRSLNCSFTATSSSLEKLFLLVKYLLVPFKLVFPLRPSDLFKTLGLGLLFAFSIHYKKNKYLFSLLIFFVLSVVVS